MEKASFLGLPVEVRFLIYGFLLPMKSIIIYTHSDSPQPGLDLLYTNKAVYEEFRTFIYSDIEFSFIFHSSQDVSSFLLTIGRHNAELIRRVKISFPCNFRAIESNEMVNNEGHTRMLDTLKSECPGLRVLTLDFRYSAWELRRLKILHAEIPGLLTRVISLLDSRFRLFPSLEAIKVEMPVRRHRENVISEMEKYGWVVEMVDGW